MNEDKIPDILKPQALALVAEDPDLEASRKQVAKKVKTIIPNPENPVANKETEKPSIPEKKISLEDFHSDLTIFDLQLWRKFLFNNFQQDITDPNSSHPAKAIYRMMVPTRNNSISTIEFQKRKEDFVVLFQGLLNIHPIVEGNPPELILSLYRMFPNTASTIRPLADRGFNLEYLFSMMWNDCIKTSSASSSTKN